MSETSDEEVDYESPDIDAIPHTDSDHAHGVYMEMIVKTKWQGYIDLLKSQQYRSVRCSTLIFRIT